MTDFFSRRYGFAWTFAVIALAYLVLFSLLPQESIWISDEGNRIMTLQAYSLDGGKALPDPLAGIVQIPAGVRAYPKPYFIRRNGQWRSAYQLFFPWLAAPVHSGLGRFASRNIAVIGGLLTVLCAGLLARKIFADDRRAGLTMGLCAFCTPVWFYSGTFLETTCASGFAMLALWWFFESRGTRNEGWKMVGCGILTGISILFREEGFIFAAGLGLAVLIWYFSWKRLLAYGFGAALMVVPLLIYNYADSHSIFGLHHQIYSQLPKIGGGSFLIHQLKNYSFYLFLLCLPFWGQLNLVLPWVLLAGTGLRLVPKLRRMTEGVCLCLTIVCCGASLWHNVIIRHGGVFIYQSLLDHVPLFALFLLCVPSLLRSDRREIRFLTLVALCGIWLPPLLLNSDQPGMFWGGRHFLNVVPLLALLSVFLLTASGTLSRIMRTGGWILVMLSLTANVCGYAVLAVKRNFSAQYVRELAKPGYQVILTDMYWMPEEMAWIHRGKCILLLTEPDSLDHIRPFLRANGIRKFHLLLGKKYRKITNESVMRTIHETDFSPGRRFSHPMLDFFECQLFECSFKR